MSNTNRKKAKKIAKDVLIPLMAERDAALARNAELEAEWRSCSKDFIGANDDRNKYRMMHAQVVKERDALRAELDSLLARLNALGTKWEDLAHAPIDKGPGFSVRPHYAYFADELHAAIEGSQHGRD